MAVWVYDVEVERGPGEVEGGWHNPEAMGFGTAVAYDEAADQYRFYGPGDGGVLRTDMTGHQVVSFNGLRFDNRVLMGNGYLESPWQDIDLLAAAVAAKFDGATVEEAEHRFGNHAVHDGSIGLDALARATLGLGKTGHGARPPELIRAGRWAEVFAYNLHDVRLTWLLYGFALVYGFWVDGHGNVLRVEV